MGLCVGYGPHGPVCALWRLDVCHLPRASIYHLIFFVPNKNDICFWVELIASPPFKMNGRQTQRSYGSPNENGGSIHKGIHRGRGRSKCKWLSEMHQQKLNELLVSIHSCVNVWFIEWMCAIGQWTNTSSATCKKDHLCQCPRFNGAEIQRHKFGIWTDGTIIHLTAGE